ncbi:uncharacterized protein MONBRDRAFT_22889 [Monosiga brevicollis MX1]|uniref:Protein kinase domain-containing protein n=1 Tax=Monosiga brevicollis TaxID=81824 RepID=A9USD3_MONBE|nr:uncharacterized protein MONBRDRAFT_22889 [Monosiga brevicollis MX1]EDQ91761.1 predicted protein [Monosiga brevicollis MX1]|eukprot:XP_001743047.1 hypothetical protein [Monosiga brevicollis MX1]
MAVSPHVGLAKHLVVLAVLLQIALGSQNFNVWTGAVPTIHAPSARVGAVLVELDGAFHACTQWHPGRESIACFGGLSLDPLTQTIRALDSTVVVGLTADIAVVEINASRVNAPLARFGHGLTRLNAPNTDASNAADGSEDSGSCLVVSGGLDLQSNGQQVLPSRSFELQCGSIFAPWHPLIASGGTEPAPRFAHVAQALNGTHMVVMGGCDQTSYHCQAANFRADVWVLRLQASTAGSPPLGLWHRLSLTIPAAGGQLFSHFWAFDAELEQLYLLDNSDEDLIDFRVLTFHGSDASAQTMTAAPSSMRPAARQGFASVFFQDNFLLFGGYSGLSYLKDALAFAPQGRFWVTAIDESVPGVQAIGAAVTLHPDRRTMTLIGGRQDDGRAVNGLWELAVNDMVWTLAAPSLQSSMGEDLSSTSTSLVDSDHFLLFGGMNTSWDVVKPHSSLLLVHFSGANVTEVHFDEGPSGRAGHQMALLGPQGQRQLVIAGGWQYLDQLNLNASLVHDDAWVASWPPTDQAVTFERLPDCSWGGLASGAALELNINVTGLLLFGGYSRRLGRIDTEGRLLLSTNGAWTCETISTSVARPQVFFSASAQTASEKLMVYGGLRLAEDGAWETSSELWLGEYDHGTKFLRWLLISESALAGHFGSTATVASLGSYDVFLLFGGGTVAKDRVSMDMVQARLTLGCPSGYFAEDFQKDRCLPCPEGTYASEAVLATIGAWLYFRVHHRFSSLISVQELQERLIEESNLQLDELKRAWEIKAEDIHFLDSLDQGSYGEVWRAQWQDRIVAVKKLKHSVMMMDSAAVKMFNEEVHLMRSIRNVNVVFFYGAGLLGDSPFLVTEYLARGSLQSVLASDMPITWQRRLKLLHDTASGMVYLHALKPRRIHRDLKVHKHFIIVCLVA